MGVRASVDVKAAGRNAGPETIISAVRSSQTAGTLCEEFEKLFAVDRGNSVDVGTPFDTDALALLRRRVMLSGEVAQTRSVEIDELRAQSRQSPDPADAPLTRERLEIGEQAPGAPSH